MRLVVDASVLVAETLRKRCRRFLAHASLELFVAEETLLEAEHELNRRIEFVLANRLVSDPAGTEAVLRAAVQAVLETLLAIIPAPVYADLRDEAAQRLSRDPSDVPTLAAAMSIGADVWTADRDFWVIRHRCGCHVRSG